MATLGKIVISLLTTIPLLIYSGVVAQQLWEWFVVPVFGLPVLPLPHMIGLIILISNLTKSTNFPPTDTTWLEVYVKDCLVGVLKPSLAIFMGWVTTFFIGG